MLRSSGPNQKSPRRISVRTYHGERPDRYHQETMWQWQIRNFAHWEVNPQMMKRATRLKKRQQRPKYHLHFIYVTEDASWKVLLLANNTRTHKRNSFERNNFTSRWFDAKIEAHRITSAGYLACLLSPEMVMTWAPSFHSTGTSLLYIPHLLEFRRQRASLEAATLH